MQQSGHAVQIVEGQQFCVLYLPSFLPSLFMFARALDITADYSQATALVSSNKSCIEDLVAFLASKSLICLEHLHL